MRKPVLAGRNPSKPKPKPITEFGKRMRELSEASRREADRLLSDEEIEEELARRRGGR